MTAPHIGNTGVNDEDPRVGRIWVAGYVVRDPRAGSSNWRAARTLDDELVAQGVVGISGIDTRALTRHLRERGAMRAGIFSGDALPTLPAPTSELRAVRRGRRRWPAPTWPREVTHRRRRTSSSRPTAASEPVATVAAIDLGIKAMTPQRLAERGIARARAAGRRRRSTTCSRPAPTACSSPTAPATRRAADARRSSCCASVLDRRLPFFGICFGNQILGRALGFGTYKLRLRAPRHQPAGARPGHRQGRDHRAQPRLRGRRAARRRVRRATDRFGRVEVATSASTTTSSRACACLDMPAFSVQYHPEAAAGPHDAGYLFDRFARPDARAARDARREGRRLMPRRDDIQQRPGHRLRPDRHRAGRASSTTRARRPAACCARRACGSSWSTPTRPRS